MDSRRPSACLIDCNKLMFSHRPQEMPVALPNALLNSADSHHLTIIVMRTLVLAGRLMTALVLISGWLAAQPAMAQGFQWPDKLENNKVLPDSVTGQALGHVMRSFSMSLGVRCSHCHVGEGPLSEYDFAADDKPAKEKARVMMRMTHQINDEYIAGLAEYEDEPQERVHVTCMTCHRTVARPLMLEDLLAQTYETDGIEAVLASYDELRANYYGGFAYDFRPGALTRLAEHLAGDGQIDAALSVLDKEAELHADFTQAYVTRGNILANAGRGDEALAAYEKALEVAPERAKRFIQQRIAALK